MAQRTPELKRIFKEDEEAIFWSTTPELIGKVKFLLANEQQRQKIAIAGRQRVIKDNHDEYGRAREIIDWVSQG